MQVMIWNILLLMHFCDKLVPCMLGFVVDKIQLGSR